MSNSPKLKFTTPHEINSISYIPPPNNIDHKVPILGQHEPKMILFNIKFICKILSLGFFCLITPAKTSLQLPFSINLINFYAEHKNLLKEKLNFMFNYFALIKEELESVENEDELRQVSFERHSLTRDQYNNLNDDFWSNSEYLLEDVVIEDEKLIDDFEDTIMADFANRFIGGGTMRKGMVQEEILFMV